MISTQRLLLSSLLLQKLMRKRVDMLIERKTSSGGIEEKPESVTRDGVEVVELRDTES